MSIEKKFLEKAISDKNYISFTYDKQNFKRLTPQKILHQKNKELLLCNHQHFEINAIKKLIVHKEQF